MTREEKANVIAKYILSLLPYSGGASYVVDGMEDAAKNIGPQHVATSVARCLAAIDSVRNEQGNRLDNASHAAILASMLAAFVFNRVELPQSATREDAERILNTAFAGMMVRTGHHLFLYVDALYNGRPDAVIATFDARTGTMLDKGEDSTKH